MNSPVTVPYRVVPPTDPVPPDEDDGDGGSDGVWVQASVTAFGRHHTSNAFFTEQPDDVALATELFNVMAAVAHMQGSGVWLELQRKFTDCG